MAEGVLRFNVASMVEDVLQQHGKRLTSDIDLASRKAQEASLRRYDAAGWLRKMAGVVAAKDLPAEPSEDDFRLGLRSGIILCNVLNKVQPGAVSKVVEAPPDTVIIPDGAALTAYQYFENVRNFLVAIEEMGIPTFEASDLEQGGKSCRMVNCVLALKSYSEWKQCGGNGQWKFGGNSRPPAVGKPAVRKTSDLFLNFISRVSDKPVEVGPGEDSSCGDQISETGVSDSLHALVHELLSDKSREDIPLIVENMLSKLMEEIEQRMAIQNDRMHMAPQNVKNVPSSVEIEDAPSSVPTSFVVKLSTNGTEETEDEKITPDDECSKNIMPDGRWSKNIVPDNRSYDPNTDFQDNVAPGDHSSRYLQFIEHQERSVQELKTLLHITKQDVQLLRMKYRDEVDNLGKHLTTLAHAANGYKKVLEENRKLYNQVQDLKGNIRVYCRVRPFLPGQSNGSYAVEDINDSSLTIITPSKTGKTKKSFTFNRCFGPCSSQEEVFADTQPLIRSVLDGYNVCIFAYGQTGSGKTFTMTGPKELTKETLGVNYRALSDLFQISEQRKDIIAYEISVQMMEIYNEQVRDLLATDGGNKKLEIRNNCSDGINVPNANLVPVASTSDVINLMNLGHKNRAVGSTLMNDRSSRSHSCLTVHVQGRDLTSGVILRGCMHLVDLAGSERLDKTEATGDRLKEAQHINRSLSALGDVISSLALKQSHVPYRNSKLTQLLQDSLGGKAKTLMFVHISPEPDALAETISTLKFAERVSTVELGAAKANKEGADVKELKEQIVSLKAALARKEGGESGPGLQNSRYSSPDRQGIKSSGSSPSHFSWESVDDASKTEGQTNSSSTSRRHSLDPQDLLANSPGWPPLSSSLEEKEASPEIFYHKSNRAARPENSPEKGPASRRHSLDNGLSRVAHEYEPAAVIDYMDDVEIGTSDSSEADYQLQLNFRKCNSMPNVVNPKTRKPSPKPTKGGPEVRSLIPQPTRRVSNGLQATSQKSGRQPVSAVGKRKPANGK